MSEQTIRDIDPDELDALIARVKEAKAHNLALGPEDCQLLLDALLTLAAMHERLADNDVTIGKLKKLVGMVRSSETLGEQLKAGKPKQQRRKKPQAPAVKPTVSHHKIDHVCKGDVCPECGKGQLYKYEPATLLRISGQSPFVPEQHVMERLRCNTCGAYFTADLPEEVKADGEAGQKYGYSARTMMVLGKFFAGSPYYRQGSLQGLLGVSLSASTIWDQAEKASNDIFPVVRYLSNVLAADAVHFEADDTSNKILRQQPIEKPQRNNSDKTRMRSGVYTSGMIATTAEGHKIVLFNTNIGHAGEFLDDILRHRNPSLSPPIIMTDALASNRPTAIAECLHALCNAHGRRQFYDVHCHFPEEVERIIARYGEIWANEDETEAQGLSPSERLAYHKQHSLPVMEDIRAWGNALLEEEKVDENSGLAKAIRYFDRHYDGLTMFCKVEGAKLDNNVMEGQLKLVALNRKNAGFFKNAIGAAVGDVLTSIIATCSANGINAFEYLNALQRNADDVKAHPEKYLPWNFKENS